MIVSTRYRDIPFEEATRCAIADAEDLREWWELHRGKAVEIHVPACTADGEEHARTCNGPFFQVASNTPFCVCAHVVEIGD